MKRLICFLLICTVLVGCAGCGTQVQETCFYMDTVMDLTIWGADSQEALQQIKALLSCLETRWSAVDEDSVLSQLNQGIDVELTEEEMSLLQSIEALSARTDGAFDPKLGSVSRAWGFYGQAYRVPTEAQIAAALADPKWDLGAALKGYAGQQAADLLKDLDIDRALLNLGGNIQTYGEKPDGTPWQIGIQAPDSSDHIGILSVTGTASVVTSGDYQRYFEQDGIRYHHIMDPETGCPADSGLRSVSVICRDGLTADALSTALFVMGLEKAAAFWQESDDFEAVFITSEGRIYATEGTVLSGCEYEVIRREN